MVVGLILAASLILVGAVAAARQRHAMRVLIDEPFLADEDRHYRYGQALRRMVTSVVLVVMGAMIGGYYLSGMDERMNNIPDRNRVGAPPQEGEPDPQAEADKQFTKLVGFYWIGVMALVFVACCLAVFDFWATRKYWMARYKELKADHDAKLQRDLAVYRQQKLNERAPGLKPPSVSDDTATDEPPI